MAAAGALRFERDGSALLEVHVQPGARSTEAAGMHGDRLKVRLAAPPVDGKANRALTEWVAQWLGLPRAAVTLVRGQTSRQKTLRLDGLPR
ncbi:MAG: YggU family protein [Deltaproteobacteria bacterium]|nr:YggU family protein [Deltaproteobacteria bacterium]MCB9788579.1 YggU family protein [Deltaproteobacteria bacterium]